MLPIIQHLRAMQLFSHHAHNLVSRVIFFADHEFLGEVYTALDGEYDSVVERLIGLKGEDSLALQPLLASVTAKLANAPSVGVKENKVFFQYLLAQEQELCKLVEVECKALGTSQGTIQLLGDIGNRSEIRQYKLKQRLK